MEFINDDQVEDAVEKFLVSKMATDFYDKKT
jgi:hypothetical protein